METKKLNDDAFMIKLLGDIYTASNSISPAFIGSRLTSQGLQRAYQVNYTPFGWTDFENFYQNFTKSEGKFSSKNSDSEIW